MSQILEAILLGILQGLTEFLPISSSAHLILLPWLLGWKPMGLTFDVVLHGGTFLAVLLYFRKEWITLGEQGIRSLKRAEDPRKFVLLGALILGTLPAILVGGLFAGMIEEHLRSPLVTVATLSGFGLLLWWADRSGWQRRGLDTIRFRDGLLIGAAQALALIPGVSRSGITITAALWLGINRADSARFSFLLGTPIIALATLARLYELAASPSADAVPLAPLLVGVLFSFSTGFLCIKYFLRFLQKYTLLFFVIYRFVLAAFIFVLLFR